MESLTKPIILPQNSHFNLLHSKLHSSNVLHLQFHLRFYSVPRRCVVVCPAIRNPKFDFILRSFNDVKRRRRYKRRIKSDRPSKKKRNWWSGDGEEDDDGNEIEKRVWEDIVDSLWILQVFKAYGWLSPIILLSFLLATGPKAFLMAYAIPFGVSLLIFAYQKIQGWLEGNPEPLSRRRRRSKFGKRNGAFMEEEDDDDEERHPSQRTKKKDHQSWVNRSNGSFYKSQNGSGANGNSFGGWDGLVRDDEIKHARNPSGETVKPEILVDEKLLNQRMPSGETQHERKPSRETIKPEKLEEKFSRLLEEKDLPVMLRLLIAVFPFLASWTNLL